MNDSKMKSMVLIAVCAAVLCVLAPLSLPVGPVPVSLATFVILMMLYVLGMKKSAAAVAVYLLIGLAGLPVFSGFSGGPAKLMGPTGGYLAGYLFLALISGFFVERSKGGFLPSAAGMITGTAVLYAVGTFWLSRSAGMPLKAALAAGVLPFIGVDLAKIIGAALLGPLLRKALLRSGAIRREDT